MLGAVMYFMIWLVLQVPRRLWRRWRISGVENLPPRGQGMILAVNHLSWVDILVLGGSLPLSHQASWIGKAELFEHPLLAWWLRQMRVIPIRRGKRDMAALTAAEDALRRGAVLLVFPEGHRSDTGELQEGRGGAIRLSTRTGCPIIPVAVWGSESGLGGVIRRRPIHMQIGEPYYPSAGATIPWNQMNELTEEMMLRIAALLPERYWGFYREQMGQAEMRASGRAELV